LRRAEWPPCVPDARAYRTAELDPARLQDAGHERHAVSRGEATESAAAGHSGDHHVGVDSGVDGDEAGCGRRTIEARGLGSSACTGDPYSCPPGGPGSVIPDTEPSRHGLRWLNRAKNNRGIFRILPVVNAHF